MNPNTPPPFYLLGWHPDSLYGENPQRFSKLPRQKLCVRRIACGLARGSSCAQAQVMELKVYKALPEWTADTLPPAFRRQHNTKAGTWAQLTVLAGSLRFTFMTEDGTETSSAIWTADTEPQLVDPGVWHKVEPLDEELRCQLSFLCEAEHYFEKKYGLSATHSEVRALLPELVSSGGTHVLDLGCGRGRNSTFLATQGFSVTAVDRNDASISALMNTERAEELPIDAREYDICTASLESVLPDKKTDHIICTVVFQFLDAERVPAVLTNMKQVVRQSGLVLIVAPVTSPSMPCPIDFPFVFQKGELRDYFADWSILRYDETPGEFHRRDENGNRCQAEFATLVARRP